MYVGLQKKFNQVQLLGKIPFSINILCHVTGKDKQQNWAMWCSILYFATAKLLQVWPASHGLANWQLSVNTDGCLSHYVGCEKLACCPWCNPTFALKELEWIPAPGEAWKHYSQCWGSVDGWMHGWMDGKMSSLVPILHIMKFIIFLCRWQCHDVNLNLTIGAQSEKKLLFWTSLLIVSLSYLLCTWCSPSQYIHTNKLQLF